MNIIKKIRSAIEYVYYFFCAILIRSFGGKVQKNRIILWSYHYSKYACNPRSIAEYMLSHYGNDIEIYLALMENVDTECIDSDIKIVRWKSLRYLYILYTSKIVITNARIYVSSFFWKKRDQIYLQTWHSSMRLKKIEKDTSHELPFIYKLFAKIDSYQLDYILSGSEFSTEIIKRAFGVKNAAILEYGTPRNDILFNADMEFKRYLVKKINITSQIRKIILYAPTFRRNFNTDIYQIDYEKIIYAFETLFGEKCILLLRLHPSFPIGHKLSAMSEYVIDVTDYQDIQELLCISDVLITDYSSCMFDFSLLYRPCFLYVPDISTYDRGTYLQIDELPFPHATNMDEFYAAVVHFNLEDYKQRNRLFIEQKIHSFENGNATENVCNRLIQHLK